MPDDENRWIGDALRVEADAYELDVAALLTRLSEQEGRSFTPSPTQPADRPQAVVLPGPQRVRGRAGGSAGLPRPRTPRRGWLPAAFAVAAVCALVLAVAVVGSWSRQPDGGRVQPARSASSAPTLLSPAPTGTAAVPVPSLPPAISATSSASASVTPSPAGAGLAAALSWRASGQVLAAGPAAAGGTAGLKDPTVVLHDGHWHVFGTAVEGDALGLVHLRLTAWSRAGSATAFHLDRTAVGAGYRASPQVFWFAPQKVWYLVYQTDAGASYSTNPDIDDETGWTAPQTFYAGVPRTVRDNLGDGVWVDMWVVCDSVTCHLFSTDTLGRLYRSQTGLADFPSGMSEPVIALREPTGNDLLDGAAVYRLAGGGGYLLLAEAIDRAGHRYTRSWHASTPAGPWTPRREPFAAAATTTFAGSPWTEDISQGELVRAGEDQTMTVEPCGLRYLVSGHRPTAAGQVPAWRLGLLTQSPSSC